MLRFLEVALSIFLAGKPRGKSICEIKNNPIVTRLPGCNLEFVDFCPQTEFIFFAIDAENNTLSCRCIATPGNGDKLAVRIYQLFNRNYLAIPSKS